MHLLAARRDEKLRGSMESIHRSSRGAQAHRPGATVGAMEVGEGRIPPGGQEVKAGDGPL